MLKHFRKDLKRNSCSSLSSRICGRGHGRNNACKHFEEAPDEAQGLFVELDQLKLSIESKSGLFLLQGLDLSSRF